MKAFSLFLFFMFPIFFAHAMTASICVSPEKIIQGEPAVITLDGIFSTSTVRELTFDQKKVPVFLFENKVRAFIGVDLRGKVGTSTIALTLLDGTRFEKPFVVEKRKREVAPLGIPEKLGGNTKVSTEKLVSRLDIENQEIAQIHTGLKAFWKEKFQSPLQKLQVTDMYGYTRETNGSEIAHKGADFHADIGTPVYAMNRGVVRLAKTYTVYGKTIIVDHGLGLSTLYMHLSKIYVDVGELVLPGELIGLSGDTGYAENPHLHISIKIHKISIDPLKFLELFNSH